MDTEYLVDLIKLAGLTLQAKSISILGREDMSYSERRAVLVEAMESFEKTVAQVMKATESK